VDRPACADVVSWYGWHSVIHASWSFIASSAPAGVINTQDGAVHAISTEAFASMCLRYPAHTCRGTSAFSMYMIRRLNTTMAVFVPQYFCTVGF